LINNTGESDISNSTDVTNYVTFSAEYWPGKLCAIDGNLSDIKDPQNAQNLLIGLS